MPLSESSSRLAIVTWACLWLPGLCVAGWRAERLLRAGREARAVGDTLACLAVPLLAYGAYALSEASRRATALHATVSWGAWLSPAWVALPYAVSTLYLIVRHRRAPRPPMSARWWSAVLVGLLAVLGFAPGLLMTQMVVLVGT